MGLLERIRGFGFPLFAARLHNASETNQESDIRGGSTLRAEEQEFYLNMSVQIHSKYWVGNNFVKDSALLLLPWRASKAVFSP